MMICVVRSVPRKYIALKACKRLFCQNMSDNSQLCYLKDLFLKSVKSVQPATLLQDRIQFLSYNQENTATLRVCGYDYKLSNRKVRVLGFGKAVIGMAKETKRILGDYILDGILIAPAGTTEMLSLNCFSNKFTIMEGAVNNIADADSVKAAKMAFDYVKRLKEQDLLLVLISGGGSALLSLPVDGVEYKDKADLIRSLADRGARIDEMNTVRKKLSAVKGGRLAQAAQPAQVVALTLSDVIGDRLDVIASGPTVPNDDADDAAKNIVEKFHLQDHLSTAMHEYIYNIRDSYESQGPNWPTNSKTYVIGNNKVAAETASKEAMVKAYSPCTICTTIQGDVVEISKTYAEIAYETRKYLKGYVKTKDYTKKFANICERARKERNVDITIPNDLESSAETWHNSKNGVILIFAGEPTVRVSNNSGGIGGRSQHLALLFSQHINEIIIDDPNCNDIWLLCGGTDGADGPTDAAGAIGYAQLVAEATKEGFDVAQAIRDCDSYGFWSKFKDGSRLIRTGPTGTNVMDLHFLLVAKS